jgi:hypothetical protein
MAGNPFFSSICGQYWKDGLSGLGVYFFAYTWSFSLSLSRWFSCFYGQWTGDWPQRLQFCMKVDFLSCYHHKRRMERLRALFLPKHERREGKRKQRIFCVYKYICTYVHTYIHVLYACIRGKELAFTLGLYFLNNFSFTPKLLLTFMVRSASSFWKAEHQVSMSLSYSTQVNFQLKSHLNSPTLDFIAWKKSLSFWNGVNCWMDPIYSSHVCVLY